jgi:DNA primase
MRIDNEEIATIKRTHDLIDVVRSYGVTLTKKGSNYVGLCPFHEEQTPSFTVNPKTSLYHCFGCGVGGDVIGFICKKEGIGFKEAVEKLAPPMTGTKPGARNKSNGNGNNGTEKTPSVSVQTVNRTKLLNRVVSFYHTTFLEDNRAMAYLKGRGITDTALFADFSIGFGGLLNCSGLQQKGTTAG